MHFLGKDLKLSAIVAPKLNADHKEKLVKILREHKRVIAWKISDRRGFNPYFCTYKF